MRDVSISRLRSHLPEYIRLASRGPIRITSHGREVARLTAPEDARAEARKILAGIRKTAKIGDLISPALTDWDVLE